MNFESIPMLMARLSLALSAVCAAALNAHAGYTNLQSAYAALGFDPKFPGNAVVVFCSDQHMNLNGPASPGKVVTTNLDYRFVNAVNSMDPPPAKIVTAGDNSSSMAALPGGDATGDAVTYSQATNEMAIFAAEIKRFTNIDQTNIVWVPGNHEQGAYETNADAFRFMYPNMPTCQAFDLAGTRFLLVNSGNYGEPVPWEREWLKQQVAAIPPTQEVAVVTHQPPFHNGAAHRGVALLLKDLFKDWQTRWWVLDGHEHARGLEVYNIGRSNVAQLTVGAASTNTFVGMRYDNGFIIVCMSNGIAGHIYFHLADQTYEPGQPPDWTYPQRYVGPFEDVSGLLWRRLKTRPLAPEMAFVGKYTINSIDWWAYPDELQWAIPLAPHGNLATHFLLLVAGWSNTNTVEVATNQVDWMPITVPGQTNWAFTGTNWIPRVIPLATNMVYAFPIPPELRSWPTLYFRFHNDTSLDAGNNWVAGWGLSTTNPGPLITYPQFEAVPEQQAIPGRVFSLDLPVSDPYVPPDVLSFRLLSGPTNATLNQATGRFEWLVPPETASGMVTFQAKVVDDGFPLMGDTREYLISVLPASGALVAAPFWRDGSPVLMVLGKAGTTYDVLGSDDLASWNLIWTTNAQTAAFEFVDPEGARVQQRFYRVQAR